MLSAFSSGSAANLPVTVLLVSAAPQDQVSLSDIFRGSRFQLLCAWSAWDGLELIRRHHAEIAVVICQHTLPDGDWRSLLVQMQKLSPRPSLVVSSRLADERLWADVLSFGAFDLLLGAPFEPEEVLRVTAGASSERMNSVPPAVLPRISPAPARYSARGGSVGLAS